MPTGMSYHAGPLATLHHGDCIEVMAAMEPNSIDAIVCDPPYGLGKEPDIAALLTDWVAEKGHDQSSGGFMGKTWDSIVPGPRYWRQAFRAMKPGAHLLAFGGTRTYDLLVIALRLAGFEIRDTINWLYGCLSEDTEIWTVDGWKHHTAIETHPVLCYNVDGDSFEWHKPKEVFVYEVSDTVYRIQSDKTDQIVTRGHRCLVERSGKYIFKRASTLQRQETIPFLENLPDVRQTVPSLHQRAGDKKQVLHPGMCSCGNWEGKQWQQAPKRAQSQSENSLPNMWQGILPQQKTRKENARELLFQSLQWYQAWSGMERLCSQRQSSMVGRVGEKLYREDDRRFQSSVERRGNLSPPQGQLQAVQNKVCPMPKRIHSYGAEGRICDGASLDSSSAHRTPFEAFRSRTPQRPQPREQRSSEPNAIRQQQPAQKTRGYRATSPTLATVTPVHYQGTVWCVSVPTGAFVARRNGHIFVTGNSGFPKSLNVSKAIDKMAGAEREVVGYYLMPSDSDAGNRGKIIRRPTPDVSAFAPGALPDGSPITAPATDDAVKWEGWHTALKPGHEMICLARKPLSERTIARNVLRWGTGAINVDETRIQSVVLDSDRRTTKSGVSTGPVTFGLTEGRLPYNGQRHNPQGRWPPNVVFTHDARCRKVGSKRVKGSRNEKPCDYQGLPGAFGNKGARPARGIGDADGMETVDAWECVEGCPVAELGRQSGELVSGAITTGQRQGVNFAGTKGRVAQYSIASDKGTAARFYPCFAWQEADFWPFLYQAKASRAERERGLLGHIPCRVCGQLDTEYHVGKVGARLLAIAGLYPHLPAEVLFADMVRCRRDNHPTVKSLALMKWLITLITPPGGVVLDPFAGSGTTLVAAKELGIKSIGIELNNTDAEPYCEIAKRRIMAARAGLL